MSFYVHKAVSALGIP